MILPMALVWTCNEQINPPKLNTWFRMKFQLTSYVDQIGCLFYYRSLNISILLACTSSLCFFSQMSVEPFIISTYTYSMGPVLYSRWSKQLSLVALCFCLIFWVQAAVYYFVLQHWIFGMSDEFYVSMKPLGHVLLKK